MTGKKLQKYLYYYKHIRSCSASIPSRFDRGVHQACVELNEEAGAFGGTKVNYFFFFFFCIEARKAGDSRHQHNLPSNSYKNKTGAADPFRLSAKMLLHQYPP